MTSTIKVNTIQNTCGADIIKESGNTITIGASGDTVTLGSGASQTGFGRTGTVDWQTGSIKTSTFTAADGEGYFVDTSSGAITVNLPAGSAGAIVAFSDYTRTFQTNNLTISPNGSNKIGGVADDATLSTEGQTATFVFVDATEGWINIQETSNSVTGAVFITATGGTITTSGNDKIHTFTSPGTFCVSQVATDSTNNQVSYMVVAGGGGGGGGEKAPSLSPRGGGGGGAGGFREDKSPVTPYTASPLEGAGAISVTASGFPITVGGGGAKSPMPITDNGTTGSPSIFSTITSAGGGGGGSSHLGGSVRGAEAGGSGGGGSAGGGSSNGAGGAGNTPPVSPPQGNNGGSGSTNPGQGGDGGGGATAVGAVGGGPSAPSPNSPGGNGGAGATTSINASPTAFAGGGGGGAGESPTNAGTGGTGGGGTGAGNPGPAGVAGSTNTGGGGGGGAASGGANHCGGNGGSGVVIIRYKFQQVNYE